MTTSQPRLPREPRLRSNSTSHSSASDGQQDANLSRSVATFALTNGQSQLDSLLWLVRHWNVPHAQSSCCSLHTAIASALRAMKLLQKRSGCDATWCPHVGWQCAACTCMNQFGVDACELCQTARQVKGPSASNASVSTSVTAEKTTAHANEEFLTVDSPSASDELPRRRPLLRLASVDDDRSDSSSYALEACSARPPLPSGSSASHRQSKPMRHRREAPRNKSGGNVNLDAKQRVLADFKETPTRVITSIAKEGLFQINPRGEGCCKFHICVAALHRALSTISAGDCDADFAPYTEWQCQTCLTMNGHEPDEDAECETCGNLRC